MTKRAMERAVLLAQLIVSAEKLDLAIQRAQFECCVEPLFRGSIWAAHWGAYGD